MNTAVIYNSYEIPQVNLNSYTARPLHQEDDRRRRLAV